MSYLSERLTTDNDVARKVSSEDYARLLGYPADWPLERTVLNLAESSRDWYRCHGRPWIFARQVDIVRIEEREIELAPHFAPGAPGAGAPGATLLSSVLARRLRRAEAEALAVVTVSAGPEVDQRAARLWQGERPDEAYFLDRFGAAVAEHLAAACGETLRTANSAGRLVALPGYSPGYSGWDLAQQTLVYDLLTDGLREPLPGPLRVLESGMLTPKHSLLAVFGMTLRYDLATQAWAKNRCAWCSLTDCSFRRAQSTEGRPSRRHP